MLFHTYLPACARCVCGILCSGVHCRALECMVTELQQRQTLKPQTHANARPWNAAVLKCEVRPPPSSLSRPSLESVRRTRSGLGMRFQSLGLGFRSSGASSSLFLASSAQPSAHNFGDPHSQVCESVSVGVLPWDDPKPGPISAASAHCC